MSILIYALLEELEKIVEEKLVTNMEEESFACIISSTNREIQVKQYFEKSEQELTQNTTKRALLATRGATSLKPKLPYLKNPIAQSL